MKYVLILILGVVLGGLTGYTYGFGEGYKDCKNDLLNKLSKPADMVKKGIGNSIEPLFSNIINLEND